MMASQAWPGPSVVRKIAVLRPNAVGDFVFALPALHALKAAYPQAKLVYIGKQWHADFLSGRPGPVDEVQVLPPCPGVGRAHDEKIDPEPLKRFVVAMREEGFDLALQMYGGGRYSNPLVASFGARIAAGMRAVGATPLDRWLPYGHLQNRRLQMLELVSLVGASSVRLDQELCVTDEDRRQAAAVVSDNPDKPLVVLQPGTTDPRRRWPAQRFAALADRLAREGARIAVNGTWQEAAIVQEIIGMMHAPALDLSGRLSLSGLCGLLERCALLVSNDTGPLHLALAIDTPCVGIYWLSNLIESGPLLQRRHRAAISMRVHCPQCGRENLKSRCAHDPNFVDDVTLEEVAELAIGLLQEDSSSSRAC